MATPSPTVRRKRLTVELRRLRERAGLTCDDVGRRLECSGTRISRIETGRIGIRPGDVRELLEIYGVTGTEADAVVQLARDARRKGWWHAYGRVLPPWFEAYVGLESDAVRLCDFQPMVVPGLLQTEDYARAVLEAAPQPGWAGDAGPGHAGDVGPRVALRMQRQAILGQASPPELQVVLGESALRAQVGGPAVMAGQLRHLADLAARPNLTLRVLPLWAAAQAQPVSPFTMLEFADPADATVVYLEHLTGSLFVEDTDEIRRYRAVFGHLCAAALGAGPSAELIARAAAEAA
jgi:transcriptional regulator with XRE-family HTH domain